VFVCISAEDAWVAGYAARTCPRSLTVTTATSARGRQMSRSAQVLKFIELKSGYNDNGPAWIARVKLSKSGRTIYFDGRALKQGGRGASGNFVDRTTGERFWVSNVKRDGTDRHWAGSGKVLIEAAAVEDYLATIGTRELDTSRLIVTTDIRETDPADFADAENARL
jgi:hypothetical protein